MCESKKYEVKELRMILQIYITVSPLIPREDLSSKMIEKLRKEQWAETRENELIRKHEER